jgi:DNA end-binding protein Ku
LFSLRPDGDVIVLNKIRFHQEIRDPKELTLPTNTEVKPAEMKMAITLINQLTGKFDISKYKDTYNDELLKLIKAKSSGKKTKVPSMKVVHSKTKDLMDQLKASLDVKRKKSA